MARRRRGCVAARAGGVKRSDPTGP
jgi:hypothetical protein